MAYDESAANRIHSADTFSPRARANTVQQTAPTKATAPQPTIDLGVIFRPFLSGDVTVAIKSSWWELLIGLRIYPPRCTPHRGGCRDLWNPKRHGNNIAYQRLRERGMRSLPFYANADEVESDSSFHD